MRFGQSLGRRKIMIRMCPKKTGLGKRIMVIKPSIAPAHLCGQGIGGKEGKTIKTRCARPTETNRVDKIVEKVTIRGAKTTGMMNTMVGQEKEPMPMIVADKVIPLHFNTMTLDNLG